MASITFVAMRDLHGVNEIIGNVGDFVLLQMFGTGAGESLYEISKHVRTSKWRDPSTVHLLLFWICRCSRVCNSHLVYFRVATSLLHAPRIFSTAISLISCQHCQDGFYIRQHHSSAV